MIGKESRGRIYKIDEKQQNLSCGRKSWSSLRGRDDVEHWAAIVARDCHSLEKWEVTSRLYQNFEENLEEWTQGSLRGRWGWAMGGAGDWKSIARLSNIVIFTMHEFKLVRLVIITELKISNTIKIGPIQIDQVFNFDKGVWNWYIGRQQLYKSCYLLFLWIYYYKIKYVCLTFYE